ncbi:hypothetical protein ACLI4Z_08215 [Natrialbaceae archaeon A-arb3/5]
MYTVERWQYPWLGLALLTSGLTAAGYLFYGVSIVSLYPLTAAVGCLIVAVRPNRFGYVMAGLGIVSLVVATIPDSLSPVSRGGLVVVGIGALVGGIRSNRRGRTGRETTSNR